ncbi:uncharacterized protein [Haliotis cracherodii]|uniref:uncharacterized protein n=1 Tax=Haliotis cracherodii TaxID=6455 RepID=UPI0039EB683B
MAGRTIYSVVKTAFVLSQALFYVGAVVFKIEAEDIALGPAQGNVMLRSKASHYKTLLRGEFDKGALQQTFCLKKSANFSILDVRYSNDGHTKDLFEVLIDGRSCGKKYTQPDTNYGHVWNDFKSTGPFDNVLPVEAGVHTLKVIVRECDKFGMEFDEIMVEISDPDFDPDDFRCKAVCVDGEKKSYQSLPANAGIRKAGITVQVEDSHCPLDNNVHVKFYHNLASSFVLKGVHPNYRTSLKESAEDLSHCQHASSSIWRYTGFTVDSGSVGRSLQPVAGLADMEVKDTGLGTYIVEVTFPLEGPSTGQYTSSIGSKLYLKAINVTGELKIPFMFKNGRAAEWTEGFTVTLTSDMPDGMWVIPDFSWSEGKGNMVKVTIPTGVEVESFEMRMREEAGEKLTEIWSNAYYTIEGVKYDFWWFSPSYMTVSWFTNTSYTRVFDYIRVKATPILEPGSKKVDVFIIYQDGRVQLAPLPLEGQERERISFGSHAVIGGPNSNHVRPNSPIKRIDINVGALDFDVIFTDGGFVKLELTPGVEETILQARDVTYKMSPDHFPFMMVEATYIEDGMSEIDHVAADGAILRHVQGLTPEEIINGTSFAFFRRCISRLHTQSADLIVNMTD